MKNIDKTKEKLLKEIDILKAKIAELEKSETERKKVEEKLRENEAKLESIFATAPLGIGLVKDRKLAWTNERMYKMVRYPSGSLSGKSARVLYENDKEYKRVGKILYESMKEKGVGEVETRWKRKDNSVFNCIIRITPLNVSDPSKGNIVAVIDITNRKQLEKNLIESENKYRSLAETSSDIIITLDMEGKLTYISPGVEKATGFPCKHFLGRSFTEIIAPEYIESTIKRFKRGLAGEKIPLYEIEILHNDGSKIPVELNVSNLFDIEGKLIGRLAIARDITERKQTEEALEKSEEKYHAIFEATGTATMIVNEDTTIDQVNKECELITGFSASELVGKSWTIFVYKEDLQMMLKRYQARKKDADSVPKKYEVRLIDSKKRIRNTILCIEMIPGTKRLVVSMLDITEQKKTELELKKKMNEFEIFNDASVDRELMINELRKEINELLKKSDKRPKYDIVV